MCHFWLSFIEYRQPKATFLEWEKAGAPLSLFSSPNNLCDCPRSRTERMGQEIRCKRPYVVHTGTLSTKVNAASISRRSFRSLLAWSFLREAVYSSRGQSHPLGRRGESLVYISGAENQRRGEILEWVKRTVDEDKDDRDDEDDAASWWLRRMLIVKMKTTPHHGDWGEWW